MYRRKYHKNTYKEFLRSQHDSPDIRLKALHTQTCKTLQDASFDQQLHRPPYQFCTKERLKDMSTMNELDKLHIDYGSIC